MQFILEGFLARPSYLYVQYSTWLQVLKRLGNRLRFEVDSNLRSLSTSTLDHQLP